MIITNLSTGEKFEGRSFERKERSFSDFILGVHKEFEKNFYKSAKKKNQFFTIVHKFDDFHEHEVFIQTQAFKVNTIYRIPKAKADIFWSVGDLMFYCSELDNVDLMRLSNKLLKQGKDPKKFLKSLGMDRIKLKSYNCMSR